MAVRIRKNNKEIICAAKSSELPGDTYIDDGLHYVLAEELKVLSVCGYAGDAELWAFHEATIERRKVPAPPGQPCEHEWERVLALIERPSGYVMVCKKCPAYKNEPPMIGVTTSTSESTPLYKDQEVEHGQY